MAGDSLRLSPHAGAATTVAACLASAALGGALVVAHGRARARTAAAHEPAVRHPAAAAHEPAALPSTAAAVAPCCAPKGRSHTFKADPFDPRPRSSYLSWDDYFMALAFLSAQRSKDPSKQVGACIVSPDRIILGIGYNGFPRGCADSRLPWAKRATSGGALATKYPYVCHAEMNAILNKNAANVAGASLYVTMFPCNECSKLLIQAGIREVVFYEDKQASGEPASTPASGGILPSESYAASRTLLDLAGVRTRQYAPSKPLVLRVDPLPGHTKAA